VKAQVIVKQLGGVFEQDMKVTVYEEKDVPIEAGDEVIVQVRARVKSALPSAAGMEVELDNVRAAQDRPGAQEEKIRMSGKDTPGLDALTGAVDRLALSSEGLTRGDEIGQDLERFGGYPQPKPATRVIQLEVRAEQNGCRVCSGTGKVPGGFAWSEPGYVPCPACGWKS
jgi:hypothetical protein